MPFFLANPFLWFSLAIAFPIALHLIHRKKPKLVPFAALRFLRNAIERNRRSRRITQCTALLFRILIILLLSLAFAQPLIRFSGFLPQGRRVLLIVLDSSASMQALEAGVSRFELARAQILELVQGLRKDDIVALLTPGAAEIRQVFPPVSAHSEILEIIAQLNCGWQEANLFEAVTDILQSDKSITQGLEIHIFSDFQKNDFNLSSLTKIATELKKSQGVIYCNKLALENLGNCGFEKVTFLPPAIVDSGDYSAYVKLQTNENFVQDNLLHLFQEGLEVSQINVEQHSLKENDFVLQGKDIDSQQAELCGYLQLEADAFLLDNRYYFALPRLSGIPALLVGGNGTRDTFFLEKAISPGGKASSLITPKNISWQEFLATDISDFEFLFICNPQELDVNTVQKIRSFVQKGALAAIFPGENSSLTSESISLFNEWQNLQIYEESFPEERRSSIILSEQTDFLAKRISDKVSAPWNFLQRKRLNFSLEEKLSAFTFYEDASAFAIKQTLEKGQIWLFSCTANRDWSEWPLTPFFFVFMQELLRNNLENRHNEMIINSGEILEIKTADVQLEKLFTIVAPDGKEKKQVFQRRDRNSAFLISGFHMPGIYEISSAEQSRRAAVNIPQSEGELHYYSLNEVRKSGEKNLLYVSDSSEEYKQYLREQRQGKPLWPTLMLLAFICSIIEPIFANLLSNKKNGSVNLQKHMQ